MTTPILNVPTICESILNYVDIWTFIRICSTCKQTKSMFDESVKLKFDYQVLSVLQYMRTAPVLGWELFKRVELGHIKVKTIKPVNPHSSETQLSTTTPFDAADTDIQKFLDEHFTSDFIPVDIVSLTFKAIEARCNGTLTFLIGSARIRLARKIFICSEDMYTKSFELGMGRNANTILTSNDLYKLMLKAVESVDVDGFSIYLQHPCLDRDQILRLSVQNNNEQLFNWLMLQPDVDPTKNDFEIVKLAVKLKRPFHTSLLRQDKRIQRFLRRMENKRRHEASRQAVKRQAVDPSLDPSLIQLERVLMYFADRVQV